MTPEEQLEYARAHGYMKSRGLVRACIKNETNSSKFSETNLTSLEDRDLI